MKKLLSLILIFIMLLTGCSPKAVSNKTVSTKVSGSEFNLKKTKHFEMYYKDSDSSCIDDIAAALENNYSRIINDLKPVNVPIIKVMIYPNLDELIAADVGNASLDLDTGFCYEGDIFQILSPKWQYQSKEHYNSMILEAVNEFTHCIMYDMFKNSDGKYVKWLWESVASYEAKQFMKPDRIWCPTISELDNSHKANVVHEYGYTLCEYILEKWGMDGLRKLILSNGDTEGTLGINQMELENDWFDYINNKYSVENTGEFYIKKTSHFAIHYKDEDKSCVDDLANSLEKSYPKVVSDLKPKYVQVVDVMVYHNTDELKNAMTINNIESQPTGIAISKYEFDILSPLIEPSYEFTIYKTAIHEFTHCIEMCINNQPPVWLSESIAQYESSSFYKPYNNKYPTISEMNENGSISPVVYTYGYTLIEYIVNKWGMDGVRKLLENNGDIQETFGISEQELQAGWHEFLRTKYPVK